MYPFEGHEHNYMELLEHIVTCSEAPVAKLAPCLPQTLQSLLNSCLQHDAAARPSAAELLHQVQDRERDREAWGGGGGRECVCVCMCMCVCTCVGVSVGVQIEAALDVGVSVCVQIPFPIREWGLFVGLGFIYVE